MTSSTDSLICEFPDNSLSQQLYGAGNAYLRMIEDAFDVTIRVRGNQATLNGSEAKPALSVLSSLYQKLEAGTELHQADIEAAIRIEKQRGTGKLSADPSDLSLVMKTRKKSIAPRSATQAAYIKAMQDKSLVFGLGPAGTGKTYLAVARAVSMFLDGKVDRIILSRPAVEAGEHLGFLPGDLQEKVDPYLRPLYDALHDMLSPEQMARSLTTGDIEVAPLAFMRGRTLSNAVVLLDEAQNTSPMQMKMFLTRMGENTHMVINGDLSQIDLPKGMKSGLTDAHDVLKNVADVAFITFNKNDVVRHKLVADIVDAYDTHRKKYGTPH